MPSGTPRTHGGHGRPPPPAPRIGPRVRRGGAGQPADPGLDQAGPGGRGRPQIPSTPTCAPPGANRRNPPTHRPGSGSGQPPRAGGKPSRTAPKCGAHGTPRTRRPACGRPYGPQGSRTLRTGDQAAPTPEQTTHPAGRAAAGVCWPRRRLPGSDSRQAAGVIRVGRPRGSRVPGSRLRVRMGGHERGQDAVRVRDIL